MNKFGRLCSKISGQKYKFQQLILFLFLSFAFLEMWLSALHICNPIANSPGIDFYFAALITCYGWGRYKK
jgi:hypothetical protein